MSKLKNNEYIVFQPDQVLTNDHLNQLFYYLDRQNRLTRNKLIGMGIVCGLELEITQNNQSVLTSIQIDKGCGLSSEGYLIIENADKVYTHAILYTPPVQPADLPFTCTNVPFYNPDIYTSAAPIYKLMTCEQYTTYTSNPSNPTQSDPCAPFSNNPTTGTSSPNNPGAPASSAPPSVVVTDSPPNSPPNQPNAPLPFPLSAPPAGIALSGYVVVLFLEASEKDLKNCDMQDCNNNGEKMVFHIRPLLVPKKYLKNGCTDNQNGKKAPEIKLKRFNVTYNDLPDTANILDAFYDIFSNNILTSLPEAYSYCYSTYKNLLPDDANPFLASTSPPNAISFADHLKKMLEGIWLQTNKITIQYFYDYINDLILAYYEFREAASVINMQCCGDECAFPLHLALGEATVSTNEMVRDCWRQYFIYSPLYDAGKNSLARLRFYFKRMEIMAALSPFPLKIVGKDSQIKITPSQYEIFPLSQRAIPYYYKEVADDPASLYQYWNFERSWTGNAAFNLSYNAYIYNVYDAIVNQPLEYDIEQYSFFRIEGHIGLPYTGVLTTLLDQRKTFNLPFDIVAVSAELLNTGAKIPECNILDLETDFKLLLNEFLCKLILCLYRIIQMKYNQDELAASAKNFEDAAAASTSSPSASDFINQFKPGPAYQYGDFIANFSPADNTIGKAYTDSFTNGLYTNPINFASLSGEYETAQVRIFSLIFDLLNSADGLFYLLLNNGLAKMDVATFRSQYEKFDRQLKTLQKAIVAFFKQDTANAGSALGDFFDGCGCDCLICLAEAMLVILLEYLRRVKLYQSQLDFVHYFRKHPGLEHKSGVPKGGTFVLVYHQEQTATVTADNQENLTIGKIRELLSKGSGYSLEFMSKFNEFAGSFQPREEAFPITDGVVIADFYVPYLCCSDCAPVAYVLEKAPAPPVVVFDINPKTFLYDDAHNYPFTTSPAVTDLNQVTNNDKLKLSIDSNHILNLHPAMDNPGTGVGLTATLNTTLIYQGISLAITIIKPDATFTMTITQQLPVSLNQPVMIQVQAKINDPLAKYSWTVNGKDTIFQPVYNPPAVSITNFPPGPKDSQYTISLTVSYDINNDISTDTKTTLLTGAIIKKNLNKPTFTPDLK